MKKILFILAVSTFVFVGSINTASAHANKAKAVCEKCTKCAKKVCTKCAKAGKTTCACKTKATKKPCDKKIEKKKPCKYSLENKHKSRNNAIFMNE